MRRSWFNLLVGLAIGGAVAYLLIGSPGVKAAVGQPQVFHAPWFDFEVGVKEGKVIAQVVTDLDDPAVYGAYYAANHERATALIAAEGADAVPVTVTFKRPVPAEEARELIEATGTRVEVWGLVSRAWGGQRGSAWFPREMPEDVMNLPHPEGKERRILGVMVVEGQVPATPEGLGRLLEDPRVHIADISEWMIARMLAEDVVLARFPVEGILVNTPYWSMDW